MSHLSWISLIYYILRNNNDMYSCRHYGKDGLGSEKSAESDDLEFRVPTDPATRCHTHRHIGHLLYNNAQALLLKGSQVDWYSSPLYEK